MLSGIAPSIPMPSARRLGRGERVQQGRRAVMSGRKPSGTRHGEGDPSENVTRHEPTSTEAGVTRHTDEIDDASVTRHVEDAPAHPSRPPRVAQPARGRRRAAHKPTWSPDDIPPESRRQLHKKSAAELELERAEAAARQRERRARLRASGVASVRLEVPADRAAEVKAAVERYLSGEEQALRPAVDPEVTRALQAGLDADAESLLQRFAKLLESPHTELISRIRRRLELLESDAMMLSVRNAERPPTDEVATLMSRFHRHRKPPQGGTDS